MTAYSKDGKKEMPTIIADNQNDIYQLCIKIIGITLIFRDSMKLFPMSLKTVSSNILESSIDKLELNHDETRILFGMMEYHKLLIG
jgi:hypothetical protein